MNDNNLEKWEINKIGIINYWWYDEEEFKFEDGRMILRGTNGSGKSVTMTSFIPLLFDGKKTADRFDAFGNKARRLEDYVLGYGESVKEENTSYLYMEIYKPLIKRYITVGMGLRAKKNQPLSFWGFVIKDGRRIGKDLFLYKDKSAKIPLTKSELSAKIGVGGQILPTQKEYMEAVNKYIFGFASLTEYEDYIKLLLEIRKSKLSGGNDARPSVVTKILTNSLGALPDEDLRPVSESLDNMNKTKEQVEFLTKSKKALDNIIKSYSQYNEAVLYTKANNYHESTKDLKDLITTIKHLESKVAKAQNEITKKGERQLELIAKIEANKYEIDNLLKDERFNIEKVIIDLKEDLLKKNNEIAQKTIKLDLLKSKLIDKENEIKTCTDRYDESVYNLKESLSENKELADEIEFSEFSYFAKELIDNIEVPADFSGIKKNVKLYVNDLSSAKESLRRLSELESIYELASSDLKKVNDDLKKERENLDKYISEFSSCKEEFINNIHEWESGNKYFKVDTQIKSELTNKIEKYKDKYSFDDILSVLRVPYSKLEQDLLTSKITKETEIKEINREKLDLNKELESWNKNKEPEPTRKPHIIENREKLKASNISFLPLYTTIDFKENVEDDMKNIIESQLTDMGLIDALIISKNNVCKINTLDSQFADKYLYKDTFSEGKSILDYVKVSLPLNSKLTETEVTNVLSYIKIGYKDSENTTINTDGSYTIGLLRGQTSKVIKAKYIGYESKKRYKEEQIEKLSSNIRDLDVLIANKNIEINSVLDNLNLLKEEFNSFPSKTILDEKYSILEKCQNFENAIKDQIVKAEEKVSKLSDECVKEKRNSKVYTDKYTFSVSYDVYAKVHATALEFQTEILELEKCAIATYHFSEIKQNYELEKNRIFESHEELFDEIEIQKKDSYIITEKINSSEKILDTDFIEKKKLYEVCLELEKTLPLEKDNLIKEIAVYETENIADKKSLDELKVREEIVSNEKNLYKEIYYEELKLKYVFEEELELPDILDKLDKFNKQGGIKLKYSENLTNVFRENLEHLIEYNMTIEEIFSVGEITNSININEINYTRVRKDIFCILKGRKVQVLTLKKDIEDTIEQLNLTIDSEDRILFEEILTNTIGRKIMERIDYANRWVKQMNNLLENLKTSSELTFSLKWRPKIADDDTEIDTVDLVNILKSDARLLKDEDRISLSKHFRNKFEKATSIYKDKDNIIPFYNIMKETLDYRNWYEFEIYYKQGLEQKRKLEDKSFYKFSGGEKAMAMYIPLFASIYAKYDSANKDALRIISLDEAFAGVDDNNIRDMFKVLTNLRLNYVINSQVLWGEYDTVPSLAINELVSSPATQSVSVIRYKWNGNYRELLLGDESES